MSDEYGWLVECENLIPPLRPLYLMVSDTGGFSWTTDHQKALRLGRREDAVAMIRFAPFLSLSQVPNVVQHGWSG